MTAEQKDELKTLTAQRAPGIHELEIDEKGTLSIDTENIDKIRVKYYLIDSEILFSRSPFVKDQAEQFSYVKPYQVLEVETGALPLGN